MYGLALLYLGISLATDPIKLPSDVRPIDGRDFAMPLIFKPDRRGTMERVQLFLSVDQGRTWKHLKDCKPTEESVTCSAPCDGQYWFALREEFKDGRFEPANVADLRPAMKVYVNSERKSLKVAKSNDELEREIEELKKIVVELQSKVKELERARKPTEPGPVA